MKKNLEDSAEVIILHEEDTEAFSTGNDSAVVEVREDELWQTPNENEDETSGLKQTNDRNSFRLGSKTLATTDWKNRQKI